MPDSKNLTELQLAVLQILWREGEATVAQVQTALNVERDLALTTVATILSRLEKDGLVAHRAEGRAYLYAATISEQKVRHSMVGALVENLFRGSPAELVHHLLHDNTISTDDLARVQAMLAAWQAESEATHDE